MTLLPLLLLLAPEPDVINLREGLAVSGVIRSGRSVLRTDPVEAAIIAGTFTPPSDGQPIGDKAWATVQAGEDGSFPTRAIASGYLFTTCDLPEPRTLLLEASGHGMVYVNGEPFTGNPYSAGYGLVPVSLSAGTNTFLFAAGRGLSAKLVAPPSPVFISDRDTTLPDLLPDETSPLYGAVLLVNAQNQPAQVRLSARFASDESAAAETTPLTLPPCSIGKYPFTIPRSRPIDPAATTAPIRITLSPAQGSDAPLDTRDFKLAIKTPGQTRSLTFLSAIDGSAQYYSIVPPVKYTPTDRSWPMVLSLHGASVEAISQANAYSSKTWCALACPTNRRPFGFDWEDTGRKDAFEVLALASAQFHADPSRIYLTGHSMGGHGTWQLGVHAPDTFAAIAPSAGWDSFWSYRGSRPEPASDTQALIQDSGNPSDSSALLANLYETPVAILHGDADDNVPVREARTMREKLQALGLEPVYHEQPGAGHWWENSDEPGAECLDWPAFFDLFARTRLPDAKETRRVRLSTFNPAITSRRAWATILAQQNSLQLSTIDIQCDPHKRRFTGATKNVQRLCLRPDALTGPALAITLDGQTLSPPADAPLAEIFLERVNDTWALSNRPDPALKNPARAGAFKEAFDRRFILVRGTRGTPEETAWADTLTRYHAQTWWVRANGTAEIITDTQWIQHPDPTRNVILYGHADMNAAWSALRSDCPISVRRGNLSAADHTFTNEDTCVFFTFPMQNTDTGLAAVIAPTGMPGARLAVRTPIFVSGVGMPDFLALDASLPVTGSDGIVAAGFFGPDWSTQSGRFAWRAAP